MIVLRPHLRFLAAAWILFQAATLSALVPRACCLAHAAVSTSSSSPCHQPAAAPHCPRPQAEDAPPCAMHHAHQQGETAPGPRDLPAHECAIRGTCGGPAAAIFALLSTHGVLTDTGTTWSGFPLAGPALSSTEHLVRQFVAPDAPPPRA